MILIANGFGPRSSPLSLPFPQIEQAFPSTPNPRTPSGLPKMAIETPPEVDIDRTTFFRQSGLTEARPPEVLF